MSIAEFLDGLPSYDERNFCNFIPKSCGNKPSPVYITTKDKPSEQVIVNDNNPHVLQQGSHKKWDEKNLCKKRTLVETNEKSDSTTRKRPRLDIDITL